MTLHRIRVNYTAHEFEVEGPIDFVESHAQRLEASLRNPGSTPVPAERESRGAFGEVLHQVSSSSGTDRMLLAAFYIQEAASDHLFTTREANTLLKGQGVKLTNPSQTIINLQNAKLIFREARKFRISKLGMDRLAAIGGI